MSCGTACPLLGQDSPFAPEFHNEAGHTTHCSRAVIQWGLFHRSWSDTTHDIGQRPTNTRGTLRGAPDCFYLSLGLLVPGDPKINRVCFLKADAVFAASSEGTIRSSMTTRQSIAWSRHQTCQLPQGTTARQVLQQDSEVTLYTPDRRSWEALNHSTGLKVNIRTMVFCAFRTLRRKLSP